MRKQLLLALGAGLSLTVLGAPIASADSNPFQGNQNNQSATATPADQTAPAANDQANATIQQNMKKHVAEGKCSPGKCSTGKCGAGKNSQSSSGSSSGNNSSSNAGSNSTTNNGSNS